MKFSRAWAMPSRHTFSIKPIEEFVKQYLNKSAISIDPFCGNKRWACYNNDLASDNMDAQLFCEHLNAMRVRVDLALFDPPYSPRQISECYKSIGLEVGMKETQNSLLYKRVRDALDPLIIKGGIVLSFGWNSAGMGKSRGYEIIEILMVAHGGGHNDTICLAERKL